MESSFFGIIMAGGRGTRFWPVSTRKLPKQFLNLTGDRTMLQETASRFEGLCGHGEIMVVTGSDHRKTVLEQLPWIRNENLLLEPSGRNTAACIGWAAKTLGAPLKNNKLIPTMGNTTFFIVNILEILFLQCMSAPFVIYLNQLVPHCSIHRWKVEV